MASERSRVEVESHLIRTGSQLLATESSLLCANSEQEITMRFHVGPNCKRRNRLDGSAVAQKKTSFAVQTTSFASNLWQIAGTIWRAASPERSFARRAFPSACAAA